MPSTPIARSKTAALSRILDNVPKGYSRYTTGTVTAAKAEQLANKFHRLYGVGLSPAQRLTRKRNGQPNALLVMYWPVDYQVVEWLLMFSPGDVPGETLTDVTARHRLTWLGHELVRHAARGRTAWTWRRTKAEMRDLYTLLADQLHRRHTEAVKDTLERIAAQPGFHGVRVQSWAMFQYAIANGYQGELPFLFFVQKVSHGDRLRLDN